jgi:hypothetical protein
MLLLAQLLSTGFFLSAGSPRGSPTTTLAHCPHSQQHLPLLSPPQLQGPCHRTLQSITMQQGGTEIPESPKQLATELSLAVQAALSDGKRRLEITLPDGLCFGLFGQPPGQQVLGDPLVALKLPKAQRARADRELAYLVLEMFQGLGDESCACVIRDEASLELGAREWAKAGRYVRLATTPALLAGKKAKAGFGKGSAVGGGRGCPPPKLVVLVRPKRSDLKALAPLIDPLGDEVVVVVCNAPSQKVAQKGNRKGYEAVYTLLSNPHPEWRGGMLKRAYPGKWALGVAAKVGAPRIHGRSAARPSLDQIDAGFSKIKDDTSLVAGGAMAAVGAAAALERIGEKELSFAGEVAAEAQKAAKEREKEEVLPGQDRIKAFFGLKDD